MDAPTNHYPYYSPRFWHGMKVPTWWGLLAKNGFQVDLSRIHIATGVCLVSPFNDVLALAQRIVFGRRIARTELEKPPIFILGHWRSGTTLLHELLVTNPQFASPNTFECFAPWHFLLSELPMVTLGGFLLPKRRPMDNMDAGWRLPQEDEFALMNLGLPTPYLRIAFPRTQPKSLEYLTLEKLSPQQRDEWTRRFVWFLKVLTFHYGGKQLVLKSPTHTGRLKFLAELFPHAKFIHLTRDPTQLFSSTVRLWRSLEEVQALQESPAESETEEYVTECHQIMYQQFEKDREQIDASRIVDLRYEDLIADPLQAIEGLYRDLELGDFSDALQPLQTRLAGHQEYKPNRHAIDEELRSHVMQSWPDYCRRYGYACSTEEQASHAS